jgi:hypothetical protein
LSQENAAFFHAFGFGCTRRSNLHYLDDHTVMSAQGNTVMFLDTNRMTTEYIFGVEGRGIGALTVNPSKTLFVVAEKGAWPRVFIHQYVYTVNRTRRERAEQIAEQIAEQSR